MHSNVAALRLLALLLATSLCASCGGTVVRPPLPGEAPNLTQGLPASIRVEQKLSAEFLESAEKPTPSTAKPTPD